MHLAASFSTASKLMLVFLCSKMNTSLIIIALGLTAIVVDARPEFTEDKNVTLSRTKRSIPGFDGLPPPVADGIPPDVVQQLIDLGVDIMTNDGEVDTFVWQGQTFTNCFQVSRSTKQYLVGGDL